MLPESSSMKEDLLLRKIVVEDLPVFFAQQLDKAANRMAAFTAKDPTDRAAFTAHWTKILADTTVIARAILCDGKVAGHVMSYLQVGRPEVTYWIGKESWGQGIATHALSEFLARANPTRPMYARVARDNHGSRRVLAKCGFKVIGETRGFANARGMEIDELELELR
jgi:RimJ/RimL family protein N-acetyltransferase